MLRQNHSLGKKLTLELLTMTKQIIKLENPVIRRSDFSLFRVLEDSDRLFEGKDFTLVFNGKQAFYMDKDLVSPIYYDGHKVDCLWLNTVNPETAGIEDTWEVNYTIPEKETTVFEKHPRKELITYQSQIELDYPDLVKVDTKNLSKRMWSSDPNYLYDFVGAYRTVNKPWLGDSLFPDNRPVNCCTTLERATKVAVINAVNQVSLIQKKRLL